MITKSQKKNLIKKFGKTEKDTGSSEVQIALLTEKINGLTSHFKENKKDHHSRLGLLKMVGQRRSFLKYLKKTNINSYQELTTSLKIRG